MLPLPPHFEPDRIPDVWRVPYEKSAREAERWREEHALRGAADDPVRVALVVVDVQNTFCTPGFELFVGGRSGTGAVDDTRRLCEFLYRNLDAITTVVPTFDTHQVAQIFHAAWLVDSEGRHPDPFTVVSSADVEAGRWRPNVEFLRGLGFDPEYARRHLLHYTRALEAGGKFALSVWPYHALLGSLGHALVSAVEEAIFFHCVARASQPRPQLKGTEPLTEHYSLLGPEVTAGPDGEPLGRRNEPLLDELVAFDAVIVAGQAKSHCVAWTIADLLDGVAERRPELVEKVYLLEDCTSPVVVPGVVDYTDEADAAFERYAAAGMHVVRSTDPIESWPGLAERAA